MLASTIQVVQCCTCTIIDLGGAASIYRVRCVTSGEENWVKKRGIAASNRCAGAPDGVKAKGTYKGGSISQLQHINNKDDFRRLLDERYPEGTERPQIDQELWERAPNLKKNYVKAQGQRRRSSFSWSFNGSGTSQSSSHPPSHSPADYVRAICQDRELLRTLVGHLVALGPDELARAVAEATASSQRDGGSQGSHHAHHDGDGESGGS